MTADTLDWIGHCLASGRYRITARLGEGGMGAVYKAHDANLDSEVVVKVPKPGLVSDHEFTARFAREVRSLVRLAHAHIVRVLDVGEHEGLPFAVMQYLNGGSLRDRLSALRGGSATALADLSSWLPDVADALDYIHQQGYVHRDVKPDNILFDAAGRVYLGDFGIAKALAASEASAGLEATFKTSAGLVVGTPQYMAPELITAQGCDGRVDQYALAVTVYEVVCGQVPFDGPTPAALVVQHATKPPRPPHEVASGIPLSFSTAMLRGLAKDPGERYRDCRCLGQALTAALPTAGRTRGEAAPSVPADDGKERFTCPHCSAAFRLPPEKRGKTGRCPRCQQKFIVGARSSSASTPAGGLAATPPASPAIAPVPAPATATAPRRPTTAPRTAPQPAAKSTQELARPLTVLPGDPVEEPPADKGRWVLGGALLFLVLLAAGLGVWVKYKAPSGNGSKEEAADASKSVQDNGTLTAEALVSRAETHLANKEYDAALKDCTEALQRNQKAPHAFTVSGIAHLGKKQLELARADLSNAIDLDPKDARARLERAKIHFAERKWPQAVEDLTRARAAEPTNPEIFFQLGETLSRMDQLGEAVENYSEALRLKPSHLLARGGRGSAYLKQNMLDKALDDLNQALGQKPDYAFALAQRGEVRLRQGKYADAVQDCMDALKKEGSGAAYLAYRTRGCAYLLLNQTDKALEDLKKATEVGESAPDPEIAWAQLGAAYLAKRVYDEVIRCCDKAIHHNPNFALAYSTRGSMYRLQRKLDLALDDLNRALKLDSGDITALGERGDVLLIMGKLQECIQDCTRAIDSKKADYLAYRARGIAYTKMGKAEEGIRDLTAALQRNKDTPDPEVAPYWRGMAYCLKKDYSAAIKDFTEAVSHKKDPEIYTKRGEVYSLRGQGCLDRKDYNSAFTDLTRARDDFSNAIQLNRRFVSAFRQRAQIYRYMSQIVSLQALQAPSRDALHELQSQRLQLDEWARQDEEQAARLESQSK